jgi:ferredoxin, 2Fe-2S
VARIRIVGSGDEVETGPARSLLNSLLAAGKGIRHDCGGKALCGTCAVRVVEGAEGLSPVEPLEARRLEAAGRGAGYRLACQARAARDVSIEISAARSGTGGAL